MGTNSGIQWTTHTFNPWHGCQRWSEACRNCYAEVSTPIRVKRARGLELWGPPSTTPRDRTSAANWNDPRRWNRAAIASGERARVFCASLADVFEDHPSLPAWRADLWKLVEECTALDWQLLTKRPENILRMVPPSWLAPGAWPAHVWVGTTVETQATADERIPHLLSVPAGVRFLSMEPLLETVDLSEWIAPTSHCGECGEETDGAPALCPSCGQDSLITTWGDEQGERYRTGERYDRASAAGRADVDGEVGIRWVIVGGESGVEARPFDLRWARSIVVQCREAYVAVFVKQLGARPVDFAREPEHQHVALRDGHGGDMDEWPADLRVRELPRGAK